MDIILNYIQQGFTAVFAFILLLGLLIFVHEMGHFLVAKWCGVRVEVFSLGFGRKIFTFKRGDTTYAISLIPLGGYVKMYGDEINADLPEDQKKYSFTHKNVWQRIAIVLAGPLMNFFFAILLFAIIAMMGEEVRSPIVGDISPNSTAYTDGMRAGDKVIDVGGAQVSTWDQFQNALSHKIGQSIPLHVQRTGFDQAVEVKVTPESRPNPNILSVDPFIGDVEGLTFFSKAPVLGIRGGTPAEKAGLKTGDRVTKVNNVDVHHYRDLDPLFLPHQGSDINLVIERDADLDGKKIEHIPLTVNFRSFSSIAVLGIESSELYLYKIMPGSPAEKAGLRTGDRLVSINEKTPLVWEEVLGAVKSYSGEGGLNLKILRGSEEINLTVTPEITSQMNMQGGEEKRFTIGIIPWIQLSPPDLTVVKVHNPITALKRGVERTWDVTVMTVVSFVRLIQNKISPKNIGGVISIGQAAHETFKIGAVHFLTMMAAISVNLFILNLLPIPVLDGGHLLFYSIEALRGAPLSMRKMEIAQQIGLFVLMSLMVFALFNDVSRIFGFW